MWTEEGICREIGIFKIKLLALFEHVSPQMEVWMLFCSRLSRKLTESELIVDGSTFNHGRICSNCYLRSFPSFRSVKLDGAAAVIPGPPGAATDKRPPESLPHLCCLLVWIGRCDFFFFFFNLWIGSTAAPSACL